MKNIPPCFFTLFLFTNLICLHLSSAYDVLYKVCGSTSNYSANSRYSLNLGKLFSSLSTEAVAKWGFHQNTIGAVPDQIAGLVLCRGNVNSSICGNCINQSFTDLSNLCPYSKEATIFYDLCLLRYSNQQFLNSTDNSQQVYRWNLQNVTDSRASSSNNDEKNYFNNEVNMLLTSVSNQAAYNSEKGFATGVIYITASLPVIYGLSQCTPDFSNNTCRACLQDLLDQMPKRFNGRKGGSILAVRCSLRYEIFPFFGGKPNLQIGSISGASVIPIGDQPTQPPPPMNSPSSTSKVLEIASGKRNMGFHQYGDDFRNLFGYAWVRWKDGSFFEIICSTLSLVPQRQAKRCVHVALLCVQENPVDRSIMSDVIVFLTTETIILPEPKQPA